MTTSVEIINLQSEVPYSIFSKSQRRWVTFIIGMAMMFSPLSANIYLPCVPLIQRDIHTSLQLINLTITTYIIIQGVAPAFFGELSDKIGRRPIYILTFGVYVIASIGLAVQNNYVCLILLRMLQSAGASATVSVGYGVVADIVTAAERGSMLGPAMIATNLGPILGPVIGGPLADKAGWRWVFWFLAICGGVFLFSVLIFFPESCRSIVGNGSIRTTGWNKPWISYVSESSTKSSQNDIEASREAEKIALPILKKLKAICPNPWNSIRLLFQKETSVVLSISAIFYMVYYIVQASIPALFLKIYNLNTTRVGLCYISIGSGVAIGGYINGKLMDYNYRTTATENGFTINKVSGDDLTRFPIERARTRFTMVYIVLHTTIIVAYGWVLQEEVHISGPLILQFCLGFFDTLIVQTFNTLLVDIHEATPSTAAASGNIARCALSAGGVAIMEPLLQTLDDGVFFSLLGGVSAVIGLISVYVLRRWGMRWRLKKEEVVKEGMLSMDRREETNQRA